MGNIQEDCGEPLNHCFSGFSAIPSHFSTIGWKNHCFDLPLQPIFKVSRPGLCAVK